MAGQHVASSFVSVPSLHSGLPDIIPSIAVFRSGLLPSCRLARTFGQPAVTAVAAILPFCPRCDLCVARLILSMPLQRQACLGCSVQLAARVDPQRQDSGLQMLQMLLLLLSRALSLQVHPDPLGAPPHAGLPAL